MGTQIAVDVLTKEWRTSGISEGDTLLVHSSIKRTMLRYRHLKKFSPADILQSFLTAIGPSGTLLLPTFNFDFTKSVPFDIRSTPSRMGALTEIARKHPAATRSGHPMYSFAVIGKHAETFGNINNASGYGSDSPFALLKELNGKIAVLDLPDQKSMTFYHHIEEMHCVDYRYHKIFSAPYTDMTGKSEERSYSIYVRKIEDDIQTHVDPAGELMWRDGLYSGDRPFVGSGLRTIRAKEMYNYVSEIITSGKAENLLYQIGT